MEVGGGKLSYIIDLDATARFGESRDLATTGRCRSCHRKSL